MATIFDLPTDKALAFNEQFMIIGRAIAEDMATGAINPDDSRTVEARMAAFFSSHKLEAMPHALPLAFVYGRHVQSVFVWQHGPHTEGLHRSPCDHFLGAIQAAPPHPASAFLDFWYCSATDIVTSVCEGQVNRAPVAALCEAMNAARTMEEFHHLPFDLCIAARLARRTFAN